jgi:hypothetical protein
MASLMEAVGALEDLDAHGRVRRPKSSGNATADVTSLGAIIEIVRPKKCGKNPRLAIIHANVNAGPIKIIIHMRHHKIWAQS